MGGYSLESIIYIAGLVLSAVAVGGIGWIVAGELRVRALRRSRLAAAGGAAASPTGKPSGAVATQLISTVRRLGQQSAVRDPAKVSLLRTRLMQAGFYNREAPVIFLGIKAAM